MQEDNDIYKEYINVVIKSIISKAKKAKEESCGDTDEYKLGESIGYYMIVSLLKDQAMTFEIDDSDLGLDGLEPDRDLF